MNRCANLYLLSTLACQLAECLSDEDLAILSADLVVLSDMLANLLARKAACEKKQEPDPIPPKSTDDDLCPSTADDLCQSSCFCIS